MSQRIGELLVAQGLVTDQDVRDVLVYARQRSMRLASAMVARGRIMADDGSRALASQHGVPAALIKHLDGRDHTLQGKVPATLARELCALPLRLSRDGALVVCVRDPGPGAIVTLEAATGRRIILAVAVECLLSPLVQEAYAPSAVLDEYDVDLDTDHGVEPSDLDASNLQLVDLDDHGVDKDFEQSGERRASPAFFPVGTEPGRGPRHTPPGPFAAIAPPLDPPPPPPRRTRTTNQLTALSGVPPVAQARTVTLDPALVALHAASSRDEVVDTLLAYLRHRFQAGVVFVVKDGMALGLHAFGNDLVDDAVAALVWPLSQPSVLRAAVERGAGYVGAPGDASVVQDRFFRLFGGPPDRVVVVPVKIKDRVVNLLYAHGARNATLEAAAIELGTLADAAEEAFVRIILDGKTS